MSVHHKLTSSKRQRGNKPPSLALRARVKLLYALGCLVVVFHAEAQHSWAEAHPVPGAPQSLPPSSPEPPLADSSAATHPAPTQGTPCPEDPPTPVVAIRVRVPAQVRGQQDIEYRLCVENRSPANAHHVIVRNPLPANARFVRANPELSARDPELVWQLGTLAGGACREIVLVLAPTAPGEVKNCARVQFEHGQCVSTQVLRPSLSLHKSGAGQAVLYDALTYQLTVTNSGTAPATQVVLTDTLPAGLEHVGGKSLLTWEVGTLAPGQSRSVEYQVIAKAVGRLCNRAVATAAGGLREEKEGCVTVVEAKLSLKQTGPARHYANLPATYQLIVSNPGPVPLTNVQLADVLPPELTFVSAGESGQFSDRQVRWALGTLAPGASRIVELVLRAQASGRLCVRAAATADRGLSAAEETCTNFVGVPALRLEVNNADDPVEVGAETHYTITVRNLGTDPVTRVTIVAMVPEQLEILRAVGADTRKEGAKVLFAPVTLAPAAEARYEIAVRALRAGDVRFRVELTADQLTAGPVHQEESTTIYTNLPASRRKR
jgi:uncharacterized repeat protein (TIGR01451 family)